MTYLIFKYYRNRTIIGRITDKMSRVFDRQHSTGQKCIAVLYC